MDCDIVVMSRIYVTSRRRKIHAERMDSKEHEIGPVSQGKITYHLYQNGIDIKIDSMKNDGSQSCMVISCRKDKYVNELPEEIGKSIYYEHKEGTIHSTITFPLNGGCADGSTEVEGHSCRRQGR